MNKRWVALTKQFNKKHLNCVILQIEGFPSLFLYKDGQKVSEYSGSRDLDDLSDFVNKHLGHDEL